MAEENKRIIPWSCVLASSLINPQSNKLIYTAKITFYVFQVYFGCLYLGGPYFTLAHSMQYLLENCYVLIMLRYDANALASDFTF